MSRFFVGQRVRLVSTRRSFLDGWRPGEEGRIADRTHPAADVPHDWYVVLDNGADGIVLNYQIEPIQPDGARPFEFKTLHDLLNSLEGVRA